MFTSFWNGKPAVSQVHRAALTQSQVQEVVAVPPGVTRKEDVHGCGLEQLPQGLAQGANKRVENEQLARQRAYPLLRLSSASPTHQTHPEAQRQHR